jgi:hypothetical protein
MSDSFARNIGFVKYFIIAPETPALDDASRPENRYACVEKYRPLRDYRSAELFLRPREKGLTSLAIFFELIDQDISPVSDLILHPDLKFLTIDHIYTASFWTLIPASSKNLLCPP